MPYSTTSNVAPHPAFIRKQSHTQLGLCGITLLLGIRCLQNDRLEGISQINEALADLATYPSPEMENMIRLVVSLLLPKDWNLLRLVRSQIESGLLTDEFIPEAKPSTDQLQRLGQVLQLARQQQAEPIAA